MAYTDQEKADIIMQYKQGSSAQDLSVKYGMCVRTIYRWTKIYGELNPDEKRIFTAKEYDSLLRRVNKLENIIAVLKTVNCTANDPLKEKLHELELLYGQYDVHTLCEALDVSRGTFYNHILRNKRSNAWFEKRREEYRILIREVFDEYRQVFGADKNMCHSCAAGPSGQQGVCSQTDAGDGSVQYPHHSEAGLSEAPWGRAKGKYPPATVPCGQA